MNGSRLSAGVRQPLFVPGDLHCWDGLRTLEVAPNLYDFGQWNVQNSHGLVGTVLICGARGSSLGCVAQDFEDRSLNTQTQLRFGDVGMAGPIYKP